jgi:hypothetical protein
VGSATPSQLIASGPVMNAVPGGMSPRTVRPPALRSCPVCAENETPTWYAPVVLASAWGGSHA